MTGNDIVVLGKLSDPYGVRGWVRLHAFGDDPLSWAQIPVWWLSRDQGRTWCEAELRGLRAHGDGLVVLLGGIVDRSAAESLRGALIGALRAALPATGTDEYYWVDLIGLEVVNEAGVRLGAVVGLIETGASDVLRVAAEDGVERLLPFVAAVVLEVDRAAGCIRVQWDSDW